MGCKIICPSRGRASSVFTKIENMILIVAKDEEIEYKRQNKGIEIVTHKNLKSLSEIRQHIYTKFGDVFMVDDDIVSVEALYKTSDNKLTELEIYKLIQETYRTAKEINAPLFGFNNDFNPTHYNQHKPFMLSGYINASAFGLIKNKHLYFTKQTVACESHWINLLNAYHNRYSFIDKRFAFRQKANSTFTMLGGQTGRRTLQTEKEDTLFLRKMFGDSVVLKKEKNETKQLHEYQRQIKL